MVEHSLPSGYVGSIPIPLFVTQKRIHHVITYLLRMYKTPAFSLTELFAGVIFLYVNI